ncbi:Ankyrin repeat-containing protein [Artemisia annua]|uniref:Ankyrin repeat-containing protein n=1 Tax=Artemisia annua TaxID=35608 RepID=A0A2U1KXR3_ARTAN|nr:Ankyrin repeat-containing protein [Artemisia annua]
MGLGMVTWLSDRQFNLFFFGFCELAFNIVSLGETNTTGVVFGTRTMGIWRCASTKYSFKKKTLTAEWILLTSYCLMQQHLAASKEHEDITLFHIQEGVAVNISDNFGNTPLLEAIKRGHDNIASLFIKEGCSLAITDSDTILSPSVQKRDGMLINQLEEAKSSQSSEFPSSSQEPSDRKARRKCTIYPFQPWELPKDQNRYGVVLWVPDTIDELIETAVDHLKLDLCKIMSRLQSNQKTKNYVLSVRQPCDHTETHQDGLGNDPLRSHGRDHKAQLITL